MKMNRIAGVVLGSLIAVNAFAADVSGKWKGKVELDLAAIKKMMSKEFANMTPEQSKQIESGMKMRMEAVKNAVFDLTIEKDGTYTMKTPALMGKASREEKGKWTLKGNKITMYIPKPGSGPNSVTGTLSADGKTITIDTPQANANGSGMTTDKTTIVYKKG
jgi:hypothetical protein